MYKYNALAGQLCLYTIQISIDNWYTSIIVTVMYYRSIDDNMFTMDRQYVIIIDVLNSTYVFIQIVPVGRVINFHMTKSVVAELTSYHVLGWIVFSTTGHVSSTQYRVHVAENILIIILIALSI